MEGSMLSSLIGQKTLAPPHVGTQQVLNASVRVWGKTTAEEIQVEAGLSFQTHLLLAGRSANTLVD